MFIQKCKDIICFLLNSKLISSQNITIINLIEFRYLSCIRNIKYCHLKLMFHTQISELVLYGFFKILYPRKYSLMQQKINLTL